MSASIFRSLIHRPSAATACMLHPRLMGSLTPQDNLPKNTARLPEEDLATNVKFVTSFTLKGLNASEIKDVFGLLKQHLNVDGANTALLKYITSPEMGPTMDRDIAVFCQNEAAFKGFEGSELQTLLPFARKYVTAAAYGVLTDQSVPYSINHKIHTSYYSNNCDQIHTTGKKNDAQALAEPISVGTNVKMTCGRLEDVEMENHVPSHSWSSFDVFDSSKSSAY